MSDPVEVRIAAIAATQFGNIARRQLLALGLDDAWIARRIRSGYLHRVFAGVYAVGRPPRSPVERAAAAVLACDAEAVLSHYSALALWGFVRTWPARPEVSTPRNRRPRGIKLHRSRTVTRAERTRHRGLPVTSPARSIMDSAVGLGPRLAGVVNEALLSGYLKRHQLAEVSALHPKHPGASLLTEFHTVTGEPSRARWERDFPAFCVGFGLPIPLIAHKIGRRTVDAYFPVERVIVELDGWLGHSSRDRFENDRNRDADHLAMGLPTLRITKRRLAEAPAAEAERLRRILAARRNEAA